MTRRRLSLIKVGQISAMDDDCGMAEEIFEWSFMENVSFLWQPLLFLL